MQSAAKPSAQPRDIAAAPKTYAFERSLGIPPAEACRRAGGKVENGQATKWEQNKRVQAWIAYYRSIGNDEAMIAAKRQRIEDRLNLAAYGDMFEFSTMVDRVIVRQIDEETTEEVTVKTPIIDWDRVAASPYRAVISSFEFDKGTGLLANFKRDDALAAIAQLRDMHGFKAVTKLEATGKNGTPLIPDVTDEQRAKALQAFLIKTKHNLENAG